MGRTPILHTDKFLANGIHSIRHPSSSQHDQPEHLGSKKSRILYRKMFKEIIEIDHGLGHTIDGVVYINQKLREHPELYKKVLTHEVAHTMGVKDVDKNEKISWPLVKWIITHPKSWTHFSPIWVYGQNQIALSPRYCIIWGFIIIWSIIMLKVFGWINTL